jgi:glycosyltransferase involved in cell wall biosynthesis
MPAEHAVSQAAPLTVPPEPLISVVVPVHNTEPYLAQALESIRAQTYTRWELIVVDDGSTDRSVSVARSQAAQDPRIKVYEGPRAGVAPTLNAGVALAEGDLIARMDADDVAAPERFAVQLDWMRTTGAEVCGSWVAWFGDLQGAWWTPETHDGIARHQVINASLIHPTVMMHAEIARANPYRADFACEDYELWTRLVRSHRMGNVPAVLLRYRRHPRQTTKLEGPKCRADAVICRRRGFDKFFPDADPRLLNTHLRMQQFLPFQDIDELALAATLFVRLAECPEVAVREHMLKYWQHACLRAAHLGPDALRLYSSMKPAFNVPDWTDDPALQRAYTPRRVRLARARRLLARAARHRRG